MENSNVTTSAEERERATQAALAAQSQWLVPDYPALTGEVGKAAVNGQIVYYPKVVRSMVDEPVENQARGLVSFMLPKEPRLTKEGKRIVGFFKLRGNWSDDNQATSRASKIVREQDSKYPVRVAHVGHWIPLVDDEAMALKNVNVNVEESAEEEAAKRKAMEDEEEKRKRIVREMKEREEEIKNATDHNEDKTAINYYTMKMVVWLRLQETIALEKKKLRDLENKLVGIREILADLDVTHPSHFTDWVDNYNVERRKAGIPDYIPSELEMQEYRESAPKREVLTTEME